MLSSLTTGPNHMREFTLRFETLSLFRKIRAFAQVLFITVQAFLAVTENCEIAANAFPLSYADMGIKASFAIFAASIVGKVNAERNAFWRRIVR